MPLLFLQALLCAQPGKLPSPELVEFGTREDTPLMFPILFEDNHLIAVCKPHGQPVQGDESGDVALIDEIKAFIKARDNKPGNVFLGLLHRLDRPVGGVVLFAKTSKAAARLSDQFRKHEIQKIYIAVAERTAEPPATSGAIVQWLVKNEQNNVVTAYRDTRPGAQRAETRWRLLQKTATYIFYELEPVTGRSHQLRVALARELKTPIVGDIKYGASGPLADGCAIALFARSLVFTHPISGQRQTILATPELEIFS